MEVDIKFTSDGGYEINIGNGINQGLRVITTTDNKYILINYTIDGDFAEIYDDLEELLKKVEEYYGDDIKQLLVDALKTEMLNNE